MFEDFTRGLKNEAAVIGGTLSNAPSAVWEELKKDFTHSDRRGDLVTREAASFGFAAAATLALQRVPSFAKVGLGALGTLQALRLGSGVFGVMGDAWSADSDEKRNALVRKATGSFSREAASVVETTPAFLLGGGAGVLAGRRVAALDNMAFRVSDKVSWVGPGTERLPSSLLTKEGNINILGLSQELAAKHEWAGAEVGRSVRLSDLTAGRTHTGKALGFEMSFPDKMDRVMFHTHPPVINGKLEVGARPSVSDVLATADTGIIQSGKLTTIYEGAARQRLATGIDTKPLLRAVVLDHENQVAVELTNAMHGRQWISGVPRTLDYRQTLSVLSNWNRDWSAISKIPYSSDNTVSPAAMRLLKLGLE